MVECFDRIHLQLTETVLRPLRALAHQPVGATATVRLPGRGIRIDLTVQKVATKDDGADDRVGYSWSAQTPGTDLATSGGSIDTPSNAPGDALAWSNPAPVSTPDAAYWNAVDLIGRSLRQMHRNPLVLKPLRPARSPIQTVRRP